MPADERRRGWRELALLIAAAAYAVGAASTTAFTWPADVVTAIPIVVLAVLAAVRWPRRPRPRPRLQSQSQPFEAQAGREPAHPFRAWVVLLVAIVAWELAEYLARGSRGAHPTLSSMADALDRFLALKALVFFAWLCLGALIVCRGVRAFPAAGPGRAPGPSGSTGPSGVP